MDLRGEVAGSRGAGRARAPGHVDRGHLAVVELDDGVARRHLAGPRGADAVLERAGEVAPEAEELVLLALAPGEARVEVEVRRQRRRAAADGPARGGADAGEGSLCEGWDAGAARDADEARQAVAAVLFVEDAALVVGIEVRRVAPRRPPHDLRV